MVLLTGASGFLGKIILENLTSKVDNLKTIGRSSNNDFLCDLSIQSPLLSLDNLKLIIHAAGKAHIVPKTESDKQQFYNVNVVGTKNLLEGLTKSGIPKHFVFISSVSVYGKDFGSAIDENSPLLAKEPYGLSKIQAEQLVLDWCKMHNVICSILRLPLLVGSNAPGNLGSMINAINRGYYFNIAGGKSKKSMLLAEDLPKFILNVAEIGGIYNLTDGYNPSFEELSYHISFQLGKRKPINMPLWLARIIAKFGDLLGSKAPINTYKLKKITSDLTFDDNKARAAFGWDPKAVLDGFKIIQDVK
jgi:nucleoside-diphosphate-sugar epimerase